MSLRGLFADFTGGALALKRATVTLTDAQIKALPTTPITLVAAPGASTFIKPLGGFVIVDASAGAYTNINTTYSAVPEILYGAAGQYALAPAYINDSTIAAPLTYVSDILGTATKHVAQLATPYMASVESAATGGVFEYVIYPNQTLSTDLANKALVINMDNNGSGALTGGNAANTMKVVVYYATESI